jgi:non-specific serine/threonine protein kinase/serine/threonine-protein kinase
MGTPEQAQRVAEIVEAALERDLADWSSFLDESCADDPALRKEIESLLAYQKEATDFIEAPAYASAAGSLAEESGELKPGDLLGEYKILSLLGEGGMGEVYLAEDSNLQRQVAIKLVKAGLGRAGLIRHFRREERILAALTHPNIGRLYGGAITQDGLPYFVMEYVEGERLDHYCDARKLRIPERLQLFRKICSAVSYAHQHLVIHRDIKPANIRVTSEGEPKLLDFGIAKLVDPQNEPIGEETMTLQRVMTPEYASPEQVRGEGVTTASDVYSLGVVLYELLTGQRPYRIKTKRLDEVARAISQEEPTKPSIALGRDQRPEVSPPKADHKLLRGDLDNIVLMALRKEPSRRYAFVAQFSDDIRRHLEGLPVIARKDTAGYRASKFVRRNRIGVIAATLLLLSLVGGIIATSWEARVAKMERSKAERRFNDVRALAKSYLFELHDAIERLPGSTAARELLVKRALEYLDSLAAEAQGDVSLQRELVSAYVKVGNVQGNPNNANLGDTTGALQSYRKALLIAQRLAASAPQTQRPLAIVREKMGDVLAATGDIPSAVKSAQMSLAIFKGIADAAPADAAARQSLGISYIKLGDVLGNPNFPNAADITGAITSYQSSLAIWQSLQAADASNAKVRRFLGVVHERLGTMAETQDRSADALDHFRHSLEIREELATADPADTDAVRDAAITEEKIGDVLTHNNDLTGALESRRKSLEIFQRLATADPQNVQAKESLAISMAHMADLLGQPGGPNLGRSADALELYRDALSILNAINADRGTAMTRQTAAEIENTIAKLTSR